MASKETATSINNIPLAIFSVVFAVLALSLGDAIVKAISVSFPLWQLCVLRSAIAFPLLAVFIKLRYPDMKLMPNSVGWVVIRSLLQASMWVAYYVALPHLQFSVAAAAYYTLPLFITLFSALLVGERVGIVGWFAICLGFGGVVVMLRPDANGISVYAALPILAAVLGALAMVLTRTKCQDESPYILSAALNVMFIVMGLAATVISYLANLGDDVVSQNSFLRSDWISLGTMELAALIVLAVAILIGSIFAAIAYQSAASSTVASFDYSYLVFSVLWGLVFFAEFPDTLTIIGIVMIASAGIISMRSKKK